MIVYQCEQHSPYSHLCCVAMYVPSPNNQMCTTHRDRHNYTFTTHSEHTHRSTLYNRIHYNYICNQQQHNIVHLQFYVTLTDNTSYLVSIHTKLSLNLYQLIIINSTREYAAQHMLACLSLFMHNVYMHP